MRTTNIILLIFSAIAAAKAQTVPQWFFNHDEDEFVGVSLLMKNADPKARHALALSSAMAAYCATVYKDSTSTAESSGTEKYETTSETQKHKETRYHSETTWQQAIDYTVTRKHINKIGEEYIAVKITKGEYGNVKIYCYMDSKYSEYQQRAFDYFENSARYICTYNAMDEEFEIVCGLDHSSREYNATINVTGISKNKPYIYSDETDHLRQERKYSNSADVKKILNEDFESTIWICSCNESLFNTYMTGIMTFPHFTKAIGIMNNVLYMQNPHETKNE